MVVNFGDRLTRTVLQQLGETEKRVLSKYYKCKEDISLTAEQLGMSEDDVKNSLNQVRINTGLDVNDTEDNFKLHFITIAKKVLENDERIKRSHY
jgi:sugar diacid utilization regulator